MNSNIDMEMASEITMAIKDFLIEHGHYPVYKEMLEEMQSAEDRLRDRLIRQQAGLEAKFIQRLRELGYLPTNPIQRARFIAEILEVPFQEMKTSIAELSGEAMQLGRQLTFRDLEIQGLIVNLAREFSESVVERLRKRVYEFSDDTFNRIIGDFQKTLSEAVEEGIGISETVQRLRHDFKGLRDYRLANIARTEIISSQNVGSFETMREGGVRYKQWISARDNRVREGRTANHRIMHGQIVRLDERFSNGLLHPGDRNGTPIVEWIQCRCRVRPYIPRREENIISTPYYP